MVIFATVQKVYYRQKEPNLSLDNIFKMIILIHFKGDGLIKFDEFLGFLRRSHRNLDKVNDIEMFLKYAIIYEMNYIFKKSVNTH